MSSRVLFDSSVLIDEVRTGRHSERVLSLSRIVCVSTVVLAELWRGAMSRAEVRFLEDLEKNHVNLAPTENNWIESGHVLSRIRQAHGFNVTEMRELHFDVLIALTARSYGVTLITSNRADFEMIRSYRDFELEIW